MAEKEPRVSVIISTYNRPTYLPRAVQTVIDQEYEDWELLVVNDGGTDVADIVSDFQDDRIRCWDRSQHMGKAACLNFALKRTRGEYVAYLDDDDIWYPNHLATLVDALDANPDYGAAYTEPYEVHYVKGHRSSRIPLQKRLDLCRDFNRSFMFIFNHVLPLSLMHRRGLAKRVGGYDETIHALIDWNLNRKLAFVTDFLHVPVVTGEHYISNTATDRISDMQRQNMDAYQHQMRRVRADLPPKPWPKVDEIAVILPMPEWDERTRTVVRHFVDDLDYPCQLYLLNQAPEMDGSACRDALGKLSELRHIHILHADKHISAREASLAALERIDADYYYLATRQLCTHAKKRLLRGLGYLREKSGIHAVRWEEDEMPSRSLNVLVPAEQANQGMKVIDTANERTATVGECWIPEDILVDETVFWANRCLAEGDFRKALNLLQEARQVSNGGIGDPYLAQLIAKVSARTGEYKEARELCEQLIEQGYVPDNAIRLGDIERELGKYERAQELYHLALDAIGLSEEHLEDPALPARVGPDCDSYRAMVGLGECYRELGDCEKAATYLRRASRISAADSRATLESGRLMLDKGMPTKAVEAFQKALRQSHGKERAVAHIGLSRAYEKLQNKARAWHHCRKACRAAQERREFLEAADRLARETGALDELANFYENYLQYWPGDINALSKLADLCRKLGWNTRAEALDEKLRVLVPVNVAGH